MLSIGVAGSASLSSGCLAGNMVEMGSAPGPLFLFHDGRPLTRDRFVACMRSALAEVVLTHPCMLVTVFRLGRPPLQPCVGYRTLIKTLGRWESSAYALYIRTLHSTLITVAKSLVSPS